MDGMDKAPISSKQTSVRSPLFSLGSTVILPRSTVAFPWMKEPGTHDAWIWEFARITVICRRSFSTCIRGECTYERVLVFVDLFASTDVIQG